MSHINLRCYLYLLHHALKGVFRSLFKDSEHLKVNLKFKNIKIKRSVYFTK